MAIFNSYVTNYQRDPEGTSSSCNISSARYQAEDLDCLDLSHLEGVATGQMGLFANQG